MRVLKFFHRFFKNQQTGLLIIINSLHFFMLLLNIQEKFIVILPNFPVVNVERMNETPNVNQFIIQRIKGIENWIEEKANKNFED